VLTVFLARLGRIVRLLLVMKLVNCLASEQHKRGKKDFSIINTKIHNRNPITGSHTSLIELCFSAVVLNGEARTPKGASINFQGHEQSHRHRVIWWA